jgi:hypothetical protein
MSSMEDRTQSARAQSANRAARESLAVDAWLRVSLARSYDGILREELPPELLAMIGDARHPPG